MVAHDPLAETQLIMGQGLLSVPFQRNNLPQSRGTARRKDIAPVSPFAAATAFAQTFGDETFVFIAPPDDDSIFVHQANTKRPFGCGMGRPNSCAVSIHSWMMISTFEADYHGQGRITLEEATDQLLNDLQRSNSGMRVTRSHERIRVGGRQGATDS